MTNNQVNEYHRGQLVQIDENNGNQKYNYYPNVLLDDVYVSDIVIEGSEENQMEFLETVPLQQRINIGEEANSREFLLNGKNVNGIAIGYKAKGNTGIAIGHNSKVEYSNSEEVGSIPGIAIGHGSNVKFSGGVAIGEESSATMGVSIGQKSNATYGSAIGKEAYTTTGVAIGEFSNAPSNGFAGGRNTIAKHDGSIAIGPWAQADNGYAIAIGDSTTATPKYSIAIGNKSKAIDDEQVEESSLSAIAIGTESIAKRKRAIAIGYKAESIGEDAIQLGTGTNSNPNTLQFKSYTIIDANGNIPMDRLSTLLADYSKTKIYYGTESVEKNWENKPTDPVNGTIYFQITQEGENNNE